jgi:hypothetical protein
MVTKTLSHPIGGEIYQEFTDRAGNVFMLTYNDLWMLIVCRTSLDGDWIRTRQATEVVEDGKAKREIVDRLWELEQTLGGLPEIPSNVQNLHLHRAHQWFKMREVQTSRRW